MSSIGVIVKADSEIEDLPEEWVPEPLDSRDPIFALVNKLSGLSIHTNRIDLRPHGLELELDLGNEIQLLSISVSGVFGDYEIQFIKELCCSLDARFYDSEACEFVW